MATLTKLLLLSAVLGLVHADQSTCAPADGTCTEDLDTAAFLQATKSAKFTSHVDLVKKAQGDVMSSKDHQTTSSATEVLGSSSSESRYDIIIDTDVDGDDVMAITYLLNEPTVNIKAISVCANGWSNQWAGVANVMRLTQKYNRTDIPVAYQDGFISKTQLNLKYPNNFPPQDYLAGTNLTGTDNFLAYWVPTPYNSRPPAWQSADQLILQTLEQADKPIDILALAPMTNLAAALHRNSHVFMSKVRTVYSSAGADLELKKPPKNLTERRKEGFPEVTQGPQSMWNVLSDPVSASQVYSSGVNLVIMSLTAQNRIHEDPDDDQFIPESCPKLQRIYLTALYKQFGPATGQTMSDLRYWDESAAVLMVQLLPTNGAGDASICRVWKNETFVINLNMNDANYAQTHHNPDGYTARICYLPDVNNFKTTFYSGACGVKP